MKARGAPAGRLSGASIDYQPILPEQSKRLNRMGSSQAGSHRQVVEPLGTFF